MRLSIAAVGRLKDGAERELFQRYAARIAPLGATLGLGPLTVIEVGESRQAAPKSRRSKEARALLGKLPKGVRSVVLDESGKAPTSSAFARMLERQRDEGTRDLAFLIGGPDGHGPEVVALAARTMSLGPMTLPHGLVRVILAEQIYRALTILAGHPYHRGG